MQYLTIEEVIAIHDYAIREFGGSPEIGSITRLEAVVALPQQTMFGQELYPDLFSKATILIYLLIKDHPFVDGNKRTGLFGLFEFLERNGCGRTRSLRHKEIINADIPHGIRGAGRVASGARSAKG